MRMSLDEFERKFFDPGRVSKFLENRQKWIEDFKKTDDASRWTTYFMLLGTLAANNRLSAEEYHDLGPAAYQAGQAPTPERLYTTTALVDLLK